MKLTDTKITRFEDDGFLVDIVETPELYEAWISHKSYGVSSHMFGIPKKNPTLPDMTFELFMSMVTVHLDMHKYFYAEEYMD